MSVEVIFTSFVTKFVKGKKVLNYEPGKISDILEDISGKYPIFKKEVFDENGNLKSYVYIFIDGKDINKLSGKDTLVKDKQKIKIFMALMGG